MSQFVIAIGLMLVLEGLVYALAPGFMKQVMAAMQSQSADQLRVAGLIAVGVGVLIVWMVRVSGPG